MNEFALGRKPKEAHKTNQRLRRSKRLQEKNNLGLVLDNQGKYDEAQKVKKEWKARKGE
jgi:ribose 1,5-bisphosphokinase PhnN